MFNISQSNQFFEQALFQSIGEKINIEKTNFMSGGCINNTLKLATDHGLFFIKWNQSAPSDMFQKEALGLGLLIRAKQLYIPEVLGVGTVGNKHYMVLEYIDSAARDKNFWEDFGNKLALQHKHHTNAQFGLGEDNYIGRLYQENSWVGNWIDFFIEKRLESQIQLAISNHAVEKSFVDKFRKMYKLLPGLLPEEPASLLHGDLWSGNFMVGPHGRACLIDPAVYYGNREIELAFTTMFGGFDAPFYHAYNETFPLQPGFDDRIDIYNMYPYLVHVNLFGGPYLSGVEKVIRKYIH